MYARFEAALKATGAGITVPTDRFSSVARGLCCQYVDVGPAWIFTVEALTMTGLVRYFVLFVIDIKTREVHVAGIAHPVYGRWVEKSPGT